MQLRQNDITINSSWYCSIGDQQGVARSKIKEISKVGILTKKEASAKRIIVVACCK